MWSRVVTVRVLVVVTVIVTVRVLVVVMVIVTG